MNSRERVRTALEHREPDRVPLMMWFTEEVSEALARHLGVKGEEAVRDRLGVDVRWFWAEYSGPGYAQHADGSYTNHWGVTFRTTRNEYGKYEEIVHSPLGNATSAGEVLAHPWPDPAAYDFEGLRERCRTSDLVEERWIGVGESSVFERSWALVGFEKFLADIAMSPEVPCAIMDRMNEFYLEQTFHCLDAAGGRADMLMLADDVGMQQGMLISPELWRRLIKPRQKVFIDRIRERYPRLKLFYHSCGSIVPIIQDLIDIGIDVLNPIQPRATGMELLELKRRYGNKLVFCGGVDIQEFLPRATPAEVENAVRELARAAGRGGGFILAPAHSIQPDTPVENILAVVRGSVTGPQT